jgi:prevent-host-death family protein
MRWQVQEAKQRFSELLRRARDDGPQAVTRHGQEVAYVVDVAWYREQTDTAVDLRDQLLHGPSSDALADLVDRARTAEPERRYDPITALVDTLTGDDGDG